jgi:hypothetical protein
MAAFTVGDLAVLAPITAAAMVLRAAREEAGEVRIVQPAATEVDETNGLTSDRA